MTMDRLAAFSALLLGTAVGDALGLPRENLSPRRALRLFGPPPLRHQLLPGHGMISDDTEHACMTAQALLASNGDPHRFARSLAWRLRFWLLALPAGTGLATAKAILRLWIGFPPNRSGVYSAGCGPAMRAPIIGLYACDDLPRLKALIQASTRLTHTHPAALDGALAIALCAAHIAGSGPIQPAPILSLIRAHIADEKLLQMLAIVERCLADNADAAQFAAAAGLQRGVTGYITHVVPAALFCFLRWSHDFREAVTQVILLGGDTDSTAALVGALAGASLGPDAIPTAWKSHLLEWPRSATWLQKLAQRLARPGSSPLPLFWPGILVRNPLFLAVILLHGLRRVLPPY